MSDILPPPTRMGPNTVHLVELEADGLTLRFEGRLLALSSSRKFTHNHNSDHAPRGVTCSACRWVEVLIYRTEPTNALRTYVVYTLGRSVVPGERDLPRLVETVSPYEVVETLTVRRPPGGQRPAEVFMPPQHLRALAAAAQFDTGIRDAYVNRAVV